MVAKHTRTPVVTFAKRSRVVSKNKFTHHEFDKWFNGVGVPNIVLCLCDVERPDWLVKNYLVEPAMGFTTYFLNASELMLPEIPYAEPEKMARLINTSSYIHGYPVFIVHEGGHHKIGGYLALSFGIRMFSDPLEGIAAAEHLGFEVDTERFMKLYKRVCAIVGTP